MVYSTCLENKRVARHRGFESLPLRREGMEAVKTASFSFRMMCQRKYILVLPIKLILIPHGLLRKILALSFCASIVCA